MNAPIIGPVRPIDRRAQCLRNVRELEDGVET
jgi:hypothetical protein